MRVSALVLRFAALIALCLATWLRPTIVLAQGYTYTTMVVPGATYTEIYGINDSGQIVGFFADSRGYHGFLYSGGTYTQLDAPGADKETFAYGINKSGRIVGSFVDSRGQEHGFLYSGGIYTQLDVPGANNETFAHGINDSGQIVGFFFDSSSNTHSFLYSEGSFSQLDVPGSGVNTQAYGINNAGQIVGYFGISGGNSQYGFLYSGGAFSQLNVPNTGLIVATGINNSGQIVGYFGDNTYLYYHGFLYSGGSFTSFDESSPYITMDAFGVNDAGQIVGTFYESAYTGFLATPMPSSLEVVDASTFPSILFTFDTLSCLRCETLYPSPASALSSGGTTKVSAPANGVSTLLLRLNNVTGSSATFQINGAGDPTVDGSLFDPVAGGSVAPGDSLAVQTVNGHAFALYVAPADYTKQTNDKSLTRTVTIGVQAGGQNLTQALSIYRPSLPGPSSPASKQQAAAWAMLFKMISSQLDSIAIAAPGPGDPKFKRNVAISVAIKVVSGLASAYDEIFGQTIELSAGYIGVMKSLEAAGGSPYAIASIAAGTASLLGNLYAKYDPPDPNFTAIEPPQPLSLPSTGNSTVDQVVADYLNFASLQAAVLHAAERWQGAYLAGDAASQALQQNAYNQYSVQAAAALALLTNDNATLAGVLQPPSLSSWPTAAADIAAAYNAQCGQPLPSDLNAQLLTLAPQATIDSLVCSIGNSVKPSDINFDFASLLSAPAPPPSSLVSAILPASRSVQLGNAATAFATIINTASTTAPSCSIAPLGNVPVNFTYQTTNPTTNALTGTANTPIDIAAGAAQSFVVALAPTAALDPATVAFSFACGGASFAQPQTGVNTLLLSSSLTPVPDIVALAATASNDGILHIPGAAGAGAFAVASVDVGAASAITVSANSGGVTLPLALNLCQTNPTTGQCLAPPAPSTTTTISSGATPTFAIFGTASGAILFDPANNRIFVQFADPNGVVRGSTSVAVRTQ